MPFPVTHLLTANKVCNSAGFITDLPAYYLGALAPDSVHNSPNFSGDLKKISHLCVGGERWGRISNNDEWIENIIKFYKKHRDSDYVDFIHGYCVHIFADVYNNINVWTPYMRANPEQLELGYGSVHHTENSRVDFRLYQYAPEGPEIWGHLEKSHVIDVLDIIKPEELKRIRDIILYEQYSDTPVVDLSENKRVTLEGTLEFIGKAADYVLGLMQTMREE